MAVKKKAKNKPKVSPVVVHLQSPASSRTLVEFRLVIDVNVHVVHEFKGGIDSPSSTNNP